MAFPFSTSWGLYYFCLTGPSIIHRSEVYMYPTGVNPNTRCFLSKQPGQIISSFVRKKSLFLRRTLYLRLIEQVALEVFLDAVDGDHAVLVPQFLLKRSQRPVVRLSARLPVGTCGTPSCRRRGVFDSVVVGGPVQGADHFDILFTGCNQNTHIYHSQAIHTHLYNKFISVVNSNRSCLAFHGVCLAATTYSRRRRGMPRFLNPL